MAKLLWVGSNHDTVKGQSSKAYCIRRLGRVVTIKYGSVEIRGGGGGKCFWLGSYPRITKKRFSTERQAAGFIKSQVSIKIAKGYDKMLGRVNVR